MKAELAARLVAKMARCVPPKSHLRTPCVSTNLVPCRSDTISTETRDTPTEARWGRASSRCPSPSGQEPQSLDVAPPLRSSSAAIGDATPARRSTGHRRAALPAAPPVGTTAAAAPDPEAVYHQLQFVYATCACECVDLETQDPIAAKGDRVMLVYPQRSDPDTGRIDMKLKRAHPVTGQLSFSWVTVYDPMIDEAHRMRDFSLIA